LHTIAPHSLGFYPPKGVALRAAIIPSGQQKSTAFRLCLESSTPI